MMLIQAVPYMMITTVTGTNGQHTCYGNAVPPYGAFTISYSINGPNMAGPIQGVVEAGSCAIESLSAAPPYSMSVGHAGSPAESGSRIITGIQSNDVIVTFGYIRGWGPVIGLTQS